MMSDSVKIFANHWEDLHNKAGSSEGATIKGADYGLYNTVYITQLDYWDIKNPPEIACLTFEVKGSGNSTTN